MKKYRKLKNFVLLSSLTILATYLLNKLIFFLSCVKDHLYSKNGNYYKWRFGNIFYTKQGQGSPVLLIHELNHTSSDIEFKNITDHLSRKHTVYTIDLLGCGRSDKPKMTYTSYLYVQLINDFIKNIIGAETNIIATGISSNIAVMGCHMDHTLYNNLLLINPDNLNQLNKIPNGQLKVLKYFLELPIIGTLVYTIVTSKINIQKKFTSSYYSCSYKAKRKYINAYHEAAHLGGSSSKYLYSSLKSNYTNVNSVHALKNINNSVYILMGADEEHAEETLEKYTELNPAFESSVISSTKHLPHMESPNSVLNICDIFF